MQNAAKRTRLRAIYLTDVERDLLISGMNALRGFLDPVNGERATNFARSFTARRIDEVVAIIRAVDAKPTP